MENPGKREGIVEISENSGPMMAIERIMVNTESKNGNGKPSTSPNILILNIFDANCNKVKIHEFCDDQSKLPPYVHLDHLATQNEMQKVLEKVFCGMFARIEDKKIIWMSGKELSEALLMKLEADNAEKCFQKRSTTSTRAL
ncbi:unnamed protein product, partial [Mesorhabditis belari]|uniref:Uncharacterized protein n=1 Tax=Mesorhabditis belari TaxID=2138241 RepID=A0AAF3EDI3_9BILA